MLYEIDQEELGVSNKTFISFESKLNLSSQIFQVSRIKRILNEVEQPIEIKSFRSSINCRKTDNYCILT